MNKLYIVSILAVAMAMVSCGDDFLSPVPTSEVSAAGYYQTEAQIASGVINMYDGLQGANSTSAEDNRGVQLEFYMAEMLSDNTKTKSSEGEAASFECYKLQSTNGIVTDYYRSMYNVIFRANTILGVLDTASTSTITDEKAKIFEAEASFVRAHAYFNLVRLFGDVPLIQSVIGGTSEEDKTTSFTRVATSQIYDLIVDDLTKAANSLDNSSRTRASKAGAQGLLAKVHLTLGNYSEARSLCEAIVGSNDYSLETNFKDVFYNENNNEVIFSIGYTSDVTNDSQNFSAEWLNAVGRTSGVNYVTAEAKAALDAFGGNRTKYSYRIDEKQPTFHQVVKYLPNGDENLGIDEVSDNAALAGNDWIVLRYADVLLMHVESIMAGGASTADAAAVASFQAVRDRAGLTTPLSSVSKQELMDERRVELAFENQRLFDLKRFGTAIEVLSEYSDNNGYSFSGTDLLLPIPQREINLSDGVLSQNPGY